MKISIAQDWIVNPDKVSELNCTKIPKVQLFLRDINKVAKMQAVYVTLCELLL